jgi:hypothetical protein
MRATVVSAYRQPVAARATLSDPTPAPEGWGNLAPTQPPAPPRIAIPPRARRHGWSRRVAIRAVRMPGAWRRRLSDMRWGLATWLAKKARAAAPPPRRSDRGLVLYTTV